MVVEAAIGRFVYEAITIVVVVTALSLESQVVQAEIRFSVVD